ncbi:Target of rapamycin complex 1 subunit kog1, partial [Coemansia sp. RSA 2320]
LPTNPELPADLFTSCLTTPIKVALRFWVTRNPGTSKVTLDMCDKLPGSVKDRQTPIGELNWIFTSITDTIAWSTLPREQFRKLFRQDVVVASLYRNYMLADRVMRFYGVHPQCRPEIPATHKHPLWDSLDLEIDMCLQQLPRLLKEEERRKSREERAKRSERDRVARMSKREALQPQQQRYPMAAAGGATGAGNSATYSEFLSAQSTRLDIVGTFASVTGRQGSRVGLGGAAESEDEGSSSGSDSDGAGEGGNSLAGGGGGGGEWKATGYISSSYFSNQLYAFEVWLQHAATEVSQFVADQGPDHTPRSLSTARPGTVEVPDELPAVLQVLLSNHYRLRALILLYRFMNLGPWAVDLAMAVGIHPYMSKLLGSTTMEIREILILVWARLSAVDMALQPELLKSDGFEYFVTYLANNIHMQTEAVSEKVRLSDTVSAASAFTLAMLCRDTAAAQQACFDERVLDYFLVYLQRPDNGTEERACLRTWVLLCLAELWKGHANAKWMAVTYKLCVIASKREDQAANQANGQRGGAPSFEELLASNADDDGGEDARNAQDLVIQMAFHRSAVVRAAAVYAMGTLVSDLAQLGDDPGVVTIVRLAERQIHAVLAQLAASDGSAMVRREVAQAIGGAVLASDMAGAGAAMARVVAEDVGDARRPAAAADMQGLLVRALLRLTTDPHPDVALVAREAVDVVMQVHCGSSAEAGADLARQMLLHPQRLPLAESAPQRQTVVLPSQRQSMALPSQRQSMISPSQLPQRQSVVSPSQRQPAIQQSHRHSMIQQSPRQPAAQQPPASAQPPQQHSAAPAPAALADAWRAWGRRELRDGVCASTLVDWAGAHFTEFDISLFANVSGRLQGSAALVESRERTRRLARMEAGARAMGSGAAHMKWTDVTPVGSTGSAGAASAALLHPLEPHAVVASRGSVAVFDWEVQAQVGAFDTGAAQIAALHLINPLGQARLLVGGADGSVRIFASHAPDFAPPLAAAGFPRPRLLAAFAAVPWAAPTSCGLATAWNQRAGVLLAAAAADRAVRVWDVASELCIEEVAVAALGGVTCLSHDGGMGNLFAAGSAAGVVRVVDRRLDARRAVVANWREHEPAAVRSVHMRAGLLEVVSASAAGDVKYWDLRHRPSVFTLHDAHAGLDRMIVHESAPVLLTASAASVKVWNQRGVNIGAVTAAKHAHASHASSYMRSLASTPAPPPAPAVAVAALHAFLPIALMVTDDGRVSYIQPKKPVGSAAAATPSSFAPAASASAPRTPSLASSRANSML